MCGSERWQKVLLPTTSARCCVCDGNNEILATRTVATYHAPQQGGWFLWNCVHLESGSPRGLDSSVAQCRFPSRPPLQLKYTQLCIGGVVLYVISDDMATGTQFCIIHTSECGVSRSGISIMGGFLYFGWAHEMPVIIQKFCAGGIDLAHQKTEHATLIYGLEFSTDIL